MVHNFKCQQECVAWLLQKFIQGQLLDGIQQRFYTIFTQSPPQVIFILLSYLFANGNVS